MNSIMEEQPQLNIERVTAYWQTEADEALQVAAHLIEAGDYSYALFFGHLAVEKMLKAIYVYRKQQHAPPLHNLVRLAELADLDLDAAQTEALATITAFNIEARYPDLKRAFRQQCTSAFTARHMASIREVLTWLKSHLP